MEKKGEGIHHIAFDVADIRAEMKRLQDEGFTLLSPEPKGADNKLVCFYIQKERTGYWWRSARRFDLFTVKGIFAEDQNPAWYFLPMNGPWRFGKTGNRINKSGFNSYDTIIHHFNGFHRAVHLYCG